ncbi:MAG: hypothetical protein LBI18_00625 [Planctomycetaceae bacterium]|jgi:hypothetical protein|nr:hypothetical protein [Planctomycetaceae bacterium]
MKFVLLIVKIYLFSVALCFAQDSDSLLVPFTGGNNILESYKKLEPDNSKWHSNLSYDMDSGNVIFTVHCIGNDSIKVNLNDLLEPYGSDHGVDPGITIKFHTTNEKMPLDKLMEYIRRIRPMEEKVSILNERPPIIFNICELSHQNHKKRTNRILQLNQHELLSKNWSIKSFYNWKVLRDFLKQNPSIKVNLVKDVYIPAGNITEYMVVRCPLDYTKIEKTENENNVQDDNKQCAEIKFVKELGLITLTLTNPYKMNVCYNLDDLLGEKQNTGYFSKRFRFTTIEEFENDKVKDNIAFFDMKEPFLEDISQRIIVLKKNECITKIIKITDLPIWKQLQSTMQKNKEEEYIIWFPIRYKKDKQIIIDFASLKVNYQSIFD